MGEEALNKGKLYIQYPDDNEWHELVDVQEVPTLTNDDVESRYPDIVTASACTFDGYAMWDIEATIDMCNYWLRLLSKYAPNKHVRHLLSHGKRRTRIKARNRCFKEMMRHE